MVMELEYDRSLYGKEHLAGPFEVTKELIEEFARSVGESNPVFLEIARSYIVGLAIVNVIQLEGSFFNFNIILTFIKSFPRGKGLDRHSKNCVK